MIDDPLDRARPAAAHDLWQDGGRTGQATPRAQCMAVPQPTGSVRRLWHRQDSVFTDSVSTPPSQGDFPLDLWRYLVGSAPRELTSVQRRVDRCDFLQCSFWPLCMGRPLSVFPGLALVVLFQGVINFIFYYPLFSSTGKGG